MEDQQNETRPDQQQPGTVEMSPGDEVPVGTEGAGENVCPECSGSGQRDGEACATCGGTGVVTQAVGGA